MFNGVIDRLAVHGSNLAPDEDCSLPNADHFAPDVDF